MKNKTSIVLDKDQATLLKEIETNSSASNSKRWSKAEEIEIQSQFAAFQYSIEKSSMGHIVPPEFKGMVSMFEKADYDVEKLPAKEKALFKETYEDFKFAMSEDPSYFKNSSVSAYCGLYEFFSGQAFKNIYSKMKKSKAVNKAQVSREALTIDGLEGLLNDNYNNLNDAFFSSEGIKEIFSSVRSVKATWSQTPGVIYDTKNILTVLLIMIIAVTISLITMIIINSSYKIEMSKLLAELTAREIEAEGGAEKTRKKKVVEASKNVEEKTPVATKKFLIKPVTVVTNGLQKIFGTHGKDVERMIDKADKSREDWDNRDLSEENLIDVAKTIIAPVGEVVSKNKELFWTVAIITIVITVILPLLRGSLYFIKSLNLKISNFFKDQHEWTNANVEQLIEKAEDPTTSESEKTRLNKIIEKQKTWSKNLASWSNIFYKGQVEAGNDARDSVREEEKVDFEKLIDDRDQTVPGSPDDTPELTVDNKDIEKERPVLLF